jgi:hypothetical protein
MGAIEKTTPPLCADAVTEGEAVEAEALMAEGMAIEVALLMAEAMAIEVALLMAETMAIEALLVAETIMAEAEGVLPIALREERMPLA